MSDFDYQVDDTFLQQITQVIVDVAHPVKVILFGSRARGDARPDSDLDLMVIVDEPFGPGESCWGLVNKIHRAIGRNPVPTDLLAFTQAEYNHWSPALNHVIGHAYREGRILYDRT